jgi:dUTP pyrophosphatase
VEPGQNALIRTGVGVQLSPGCCGQILSRSGTAASHLLYVEAGVIDRDYEGELLILLHNAGRQAYQVYGTFLERVVT